MIIRAPAAPDLEQRALNFATAAHEGQARKYTGEPYITHPVAVAELVRTVPHYPDMIAAALLHDVVEDCGIPSAQIHDEFGHGVGNMVDWLTDVSTPADGNRAARKAIDREHLDRAPPSVKTIKLADVIHNTISIKANDAGFWQIYRAENLALLEVLKQGDELLWHHVLKKCLN